MFCNFCSVRILRFPGRRLKEWARERGAVQWDAMGEVALDGPWRAGLGGDQDAHVQKGMANCWLTGGIVRLLPGD